METSARAVLALVLIAAAPAGAQQLRPGVWAGNDMAALPVPVSGYQVYLLGEFHGVKENASLFGQYLAKLNSSSGLRDVAIEEKPVYEPGARAYVEGRSDSMPAQLCLRSNIFDEIRRLNQGRPAASMIRVHLVDIDSPADAIRQHLMTIKENVPGAAAVTIPDEAAIKTGGLKAVEELRGVPGSSQYRGELRTLEHSIKAYQQGFEAGIGIPKGSTYLDDREEAVASNIRDIVAIEGTHGVFVFYGDDHVAKVMRKDGGPDRNRPFAPTALRLQQAGLKVFSVATFPLSGRYAWRGQESGMLWTAEDGHLSNGQTLDKLLVEAHKPQLLYFDAKQEHVTLPSDDLSKYGPDAFISISVGTPMENRCTGH